MLPLQPAAECYLVTHYVVFLDQPVNFLGLRYRECDRVLRYLSLWIVGAEFLTIETPFLSPGPGVQTHCRHNEQNTYILDKDFDLLPTIVI